MPILPWIFWLGSPPRLLRGDTGDCLYAHMTSKNIYCYPRTLKRVVSTTIKNLQNNSNTYVKPSEWIITLRRRMVRFSEWCLTLSHTVIFCLFVCLDQWLLAIQLSRISYQYLLSQKLCFHAIHTNTWFQYFSSISLSFSKEKKRHNVGQSGIRFGNPKK